MNSHFKFLRRVRIHGGERGAVARALHHKVKGLSLYQADSGKALESTIERRLMSTKTTLKRIALVAVSALGFGLLSVAPSANADAVDPTSITIGTIPTAAVGVALVVPVTVTKSTYWTEGGSDSFTLNVRVTSAPAGSAFTSLATTGKLADGSTGTNFAAGIYASGSQELAKTTVTQPTGGNLILGSAESIGSSAGVGYDITTGPVAASTSTVSLRVNITPDKAGTYSVLVHANDGSTPALYAAGDVNASFSFTTASAVSSVTLAAVTGTSIKSSTNGQIFKATIKDSTGTVSQLAAGETIALTSNQTSLTMGTARTTGEASSYTKGTAATTLTLSNSDFKNGVAYFYVLNSDAETAVVTAAGSGLLSTSVTNTISVVTRTQSTTAATPSVGDPTSATRPGSGHVGVASDADTASTSVTSHSYKATFTTAGTVSTYVKLDVTDTSGKITGLTSARYQEALTLDDTDGTTASFTITATLSTAGQSFIATVYGASDSTNDLVTVTSAAAVSTTLTSDLGSTVSQTAGTSTVITAIVKDQFGAAIANQVVTISTTGRNASSTSTTLTTDSAGRISYTRTDAGTTATLNKQDVVTLAGPTSGTGDDATVTINYGTVTASTITCPTGNEDDTANLVTYRDISAGDGVQGGAASLCTVTVKDANGSVMVGVPVTTTTASDGAAVRSTSATTYTGSAGTVTPSVYGWTAGTKTFTITAGGVSKSVTVNYQQRTATEVRTISATLSGNVITVTAKDRLGNLVPGVRVYATRTGDATFGGGSTVANAITAGNTSGTTPVPSDLGTAQIIVIPGTAASTVKIQLASAADTPDAEYGQSSSTAGKICAGAGCTDTALTAATTGTAFTAEVGIGASLSAAGVNSVTVSVAAAGKTGAQTAAEAATAAAEAATDAAAEAIDAANAATDAANLAAEAADAATVAAEEARDAAIDAANAATDSAAEAIDAANSATDAANLAAEAADAATVAAEEARDAAEAATAAVEALATQVATLMAALKAQITTLANTVAKIAKKVKA
jgi:hypothetical protein